MTPGGFAVVATVDADGSPHQAVVWYLRRGNAVVVNGRADRRWVVNARRAERVSIAVVDGYDYVILTGRVLVDDAADHAASDIRSLARRYGDDEENFAGQARVTIELTPDHASLHGGLARTS